MMRAITVFICLSGLAACGGDASPGQGIDTAVEVFVPDSADGADGAVETSSDVVPPETSAPDAETSETGETSEPGETSDSTVQAEVSDAADTLVPDTADTSAPETTAETSAPEVVDPAACPMPTMKDDYPGPFPPFPYGTWPYAEGCIANPHDVIIVLGCPSESNGSPSKCQIDRARITEELYEAGWATHFIVTGAAVHNGHVEADALYALLVERGIPAASIFKEPLARHTDENLYYSTRIMQEHGWTSALVVSEDPGHLMMTALCDSNCCVDLGRLSLYEWEVLPDLYVKAGHYALIPPGTANSAAECTHISGMFMCINLGDRDACKSDFQLPVP